MHITAHISYVTVSLRILIFNGYNFLIYGCESYNTNCPLTPVDVFITDWPFSINKVFTIYFILQ